MDGNIRIAVLSTYDKVCTFLDNNVPDAMHYYSDELHMYLNGAANTYTFTTSARHKDSTYLTEGNKLAFTYRSKDYYLNIMKVTRTEYEVEIEAYSLNFELLNEQKEEYKAASAMSFAQYLDVFDFEKVVTLGINEVSDKKITNEWTGTETMLARIFSLANVFSAEVEFIPELNEDYSLKRIVMNVYREHSDTTQGVGNNRTDITLRYGTNVSGITKTSDITGLYTAIRPIGRDGLTVSSLNKTELDAEGRVEFQSPAGKRNIYAVQARDRFPSNLMANENERYIAQVWDYDTDNVNTLYGQALAELKKNCVPQVSYEVDGYFDTDIGDTVSIADNEYNPPLYLQARVTEQQRSFTNPTQNKTTFSNFKEMQSQIDPALLQKMNDLIDANKAYTCSILSNNGIVFKNGEGSTTLTALVMDVGKDMTDSFTIRWALNDVFLSTGKAITVYANTIKGKALYRYTASDSSGRIIGSSEVTVSNVADGITGRVFNLQSSEEIIRRSLDGSLSSPYVDFLAFYREGESVVNHPLPGRFVIEETSDGSTWSTIYESQKDETSVRYYMLWMIGDTNGDTIGDAEGNTIGSGFAGTVQMRCRFYVGDTLIGVKNVAVLSDGKPMGIVESDAPPTEKYEGMLWKNTGTSTGFLQGTTYRWDGYMWRVNTFSAVNIDVDNLSSISANLGTVTAGVINGVQINGSEINSDFLRGIGTANRIVGTTTITNGDIKIGFEQQSNVTGPWIKVGKGEIKLDYSGLWQTKWDAHGKVETLEVITPQDINARFGNFNNLKTSAKVSIVDAINELYDMITRR